MKLRGVIFDLDGTLADTIPICISAFRDAVKQYTARHYTDQEIVAIFGPSEVGMIQRAVPDRWQDCLATYMGVYDRHHRRCETPFPGVITLLDFLKQRGVPLAIVSGKGANSAAVSLRHLGLAQYFDTVETGSPDGDIKHLSIQKVLAKWGMSPEQVVYIGDAPSDVEAARKAGVAPLGAAWAASSDLERLQASAPVAIFRSAASFAEWIERNLDGDRMRSEDSPWNVSENRCL